MPELCSSLLMHPSSLEDILVVVEPPGGFGTTFFFDGAGAPTIVNLLMLRVPP